MAQTSGSGGIGSLAMGGIAAVVVILGGVVLVQLGVLDQEVSTSDRALREETNTDVTISPSTGDPVVLPNTQAADEVEPAPVSGNETEDTSTRAVESASQTKQDSAVAEPAPEPAEGRVVESAVEAGQDAEPAAPEAPAAQSQTDIAPEGAQEPEQPEPSAAPGGAPVDEGTAVAGAPAALVPGASEGPR